MRNKITSLFGNFFGAMALGSMLLLGQSFGCGPTLRAIATEAIPHLHHAVLNPNRKVMISIKTTGNWPAFKKPEDELRYGGDRALDKISEIAMAELMDDKPTGRVLHHFLNPEKFIKPEMVALSGVSYMFTNRSITFRDVATEVENFISGNIIEGANILQLGRGLILSYDPAFDMAFLNAALKRAEHKPMDVAGVISLQEIAKTLYPEVRIDVRPFEMRTLEYLCKKFNIDTAHIKHHTAFNDIKLMLHVYKKLIGANQKAVAASVASMSSALATQGNRETGRIVLAPPVANPNRNLIFDTETTGLGVNVERITEMAIIELIDNRPTGRVWHHFFNPEKVITPGALKASGLAPEFLMKNPEFMHTANDLRNFINGDFIEKGQLVRVGQGTLVAHNAPFDISFLNAEFQRLELPQIPAMSAIDTLAIARGRFGRTKEDTADGRGNKLDDVCDRFGIDRSKRTVHGAYVDSQLLVQVYLALVNNKPVVPLPLPANDNGKAPVSGAGPMIVDVSAIVPATPAAKPVPVESLAPPPFLEGKTPISKPLHHWGKNEPDGDSVGSSDADESDGSLSSGERDGLIDDSSANSDGEEEANQFLIDMQRTFSQRSQQIKRGQIQVPKASVRPRPSERSISPSPSSSDEEDAPPPAKRPNTGSKG